MIKRAQSFLVMLTVPLCVLIFILFNIMIFKGDYYSNMAANQRIVTKENERYQITDKNMITFTADESVASHVIGYTNSDGTGVSGIEKAFDSTLNQKPVKSVSLKDGSGKTIPVFKATGTTEKDEKYVKLTLDYHIQQIAENVLDKYGVTGAVVVLDVNSFDILAMASRPNFDRNNVELYTKHGDTELINRAISPYNAGSIFKIITTAAALETEICTEDSTYFCSGADFYDNIVFPCHNVQGHGSLNLKEGFAKSCNCVFYNIGTSLGSRTICEYAEKFGLNKKMLNNMLSESQGNIPKYLTNSMSESSNLSIGQGEILITPLQASKLACIIASGGIEKDVNLVDAIVDEYGNIITNMRKSGVRTVISKNTANKIGNMMLLSVSEGTGTNAKSEKVTIAGKTGSAETGWMKDDEYMVQGWFIGYFPFDAPRYAIAVMCENGRQGNSSCAPVFKDIAEKITDLNYAQ